MKCKNFSVCIASVILLFFAATSVHAEAVYPLKTSENNRYLVDQTGQPFFINGDTAWSLIAQLSPAEVDTYLTDRKAKGYNLILMNLIEHEFAINAPANKAGVQPFTTLGNFDTPNESYFSHADYVIEKANELGMVVLLYPTYTGSGCSDQGWCQEMLASSLSTMRNWGRYVGARYKDDPNIIWVIGADFDPNANQAIQTRLREFAAGLQEEDTTHLITAHNVRGQAAIDPWIGESWLTLNNIYTDSNPINSALTEYNRTPVKPFFLLEGYYENEHGMTGVQLRRQGYWSTLSGGLGGHIFGACPMWHFGAPTGNGFCDSATTWQAQLDSSGSRTLAYVGKLFASRNFHLLVPDQNHAVLINGFQSGNNLATTARASDGSSVISYIPTSRTVTVDMTKVSGTQATAWWFNPRDGQASEIGTYPTTGTRDFTPSSSGDWVLVIDDASKNYPAPGTEVPEPTSTPALSPSPTLIPMPGDTNIDGRVTIIDLSILLTNFGKVAQMWNTGDFNGDGNVNLIDLSTLLSNFGR